MKKKISERTQVELTLSDPIGSNTIRQFPTVGIRDARGMVFWSPASPRPVTISPRAPRAPVDILKKQPRPASPRVGLAPPRPVSV